MSSKQAPYPITDAALAFFGLKQRTMILDGDKIAASIEDDAARAAYLAAVAAARKAYEARKVALAAGKA